MVSAINVSQSSAVAGQNAANATPETGEFDFLGYLLGLQATLTEENPTDVTSGLVQLKTSAGMIEEGAEESLNSQKGKELSQWNPIFPGLNPLVASQQPMQNQLRGATNSEASELPARLASNMWAKALAQAQQNEAQGEKNPIAALSRNQVDRYAATAPVKLAKAAPMESGLLEIKGDRKRFEADSFDFEGVAQNQPQVSSINSQVEVQPEQAGTPVTELFQKVETMLHQGGGKMTVHLSPPELGQVQIQVSSRGKRVEIEMKSDNDFTKSVLESKLGDLRQSLQSQDLVLSKMEVHVSRESSSFGEGSFANLSQQSGAFSQNNSHGFTEQQQQRGGLQQPRSSQLSQQSHVSAMGSRTPSVGAGRVDVRI